MTNPNQPKISVFKDKAALAQAAAHLFVDKAKAAIEARGRFSVVLAGGGTPQNLHAILASTLKDEIDWSKVDIFFGDERFVPHDHEQSNYLQAFESLLKYLDDTKVSVYAMPTANLEAEEAATSYTKTLQDYFSATSSNPDSSKTSFDLVFLGIGPDGHTASLFPNHPLVTETSDALVQVLHDSPKPPATRLTLSYKSINAAKDIVVLAAGKNKAEVIERLLDKSVAIKDLPVKGVQPDIGQVQWFVDEELMGEHQMKKN